MEKKPIVALLYDFDSTLSTNDMQAFDLIPAMGMSEKEFWGETSKFADEHGVERTLAYMYVMAQIAKSKNIKMTKEWLMEQGKNIEYYPGVTTWFKRINEYGESKGVQIEHYLVSSGTKEIVEGCKIAKEFTQMFACEYFFGEDGTPAWPKLSINYTQKTQFFYRISKGVFDITNDADVNKKTKNRRIPFENIIYFGDGMTDVPSMILAKENGGHSIAVYPKGKEDTASLLLNENRVNFVCEADYSKNSEIESVVKLIIDSVAVSESLKQKTLEKLKCPQ